MVGASSSDPNGKGTGADAVLQLTNKNLNLPTAFISLLVSVLTTSVGDTFLSGCPTPNAVAR